MTLTRDELADLLREFVCEFWVDKPQMRWEHTVCDDSLSMIAHKGDTICFGDPNHRDPDDQKRFELIARLANAAPNLLAIVGATPAQYVAPDDALLDAVGQRIAAILQNPNAVHINMLRGSIAKPSWDQIKHLYPEHFDSQEENGGS